MQEIPQLNDETSVAPGCHRCLDGICFDPVTYKEDFKEEI